MQTLPFACCVESAPWSTAKDSDCGPQDAPGIQAILNNLQSSVSDSEKAAEAFSLWTVPHHRQPAGMGGGQGILTSSQPKRVSAISGSSPFVPPRCCAE